MLAQLSAARGFALGVAPWIPGESRYGLYSLTTDELSNTIGADVHGAQVISFRIEIDSLGTTDRARIHLDWNDAGIRAGLPKTAFAKGTSSRLGSRAVVSGFGCHTYETRFFQQLYPGLKDLTVKPYIARAGTGGRYLIAFEDLRNRGPVTFYDADDEAPESHVTSVIELLAKVHGRFWQSPRFQTDLSWLQTYAHRPGYPFMKALFRFSDWKYVARQSWLPESVKTLTHRYATHQPLFTRIWEAMPQTLCHGDCHLGNTFANPDGTAGIYDWQVFHRMNGLRDFAYFMMHSVPTELRRKREGELLRRYLDTLANEGAGAAAPTFEEAWEAYRLLIIDGWIAIALTLAVGGMQPEARMLVTAHRAVATMEDLDLAQKVESVVKGRGYQ